MYSDVPNLVNVFGYINSSWTLRADLISHFVCRLLRHLRDTGTRQVTPRLRPEDADMPKKPFFEDFTAGYYLRVADRLPYQGDREPWLNSQNYTREKHTIGSAPLEDGVLQFTGPQARATDAEDSLNEVA